MTAPESTPSAAPAPGTTSTQHADAAHAARSGLSQIAAMLGQGLMPLQRILVSRVFGQTAYGLYRASADMCEVLMRAGMVGADKGLLRFVAAHRAANEPDLEERAIGSALRLAGGVLSFLALGLMLAAPTIARISGNVEFSWLLPVMAPALLAGGLVVVLMAATLGAKVTRVNLFIRGVAEPVLLLATTVVAWLVGRSLTGLAAAHLLTYLALLVLAWVGARTVIGRGRLWRSLRQLPHGGFSKFVLPIGGSELMNAILQRANVFILTAFAGAPTVAVFAAAEELGRSVAGIRYAFDSVAGPMMAESLRLGDVERLRYNLQLMTRWVTSAAAPIAAVLLALRPELLWLYGPDYRVGTNAMTLLVIGHLVNGVLGLSGYVLVMSGRSGLFFWNNFGAAALNFILALVLVPRYGVTGAAVASLVGVTALQGTLFWQVWRLQGVHPFAPALAKPLGAAALAFGAAMLIRQIPLPPLPRVVLVIAAAVVVYPAALLALRPGEEERRFVLRLLQKLFRRNRQPPGPVDR